MSSYPVDETRSEDGLECPHCGHLHEPGFESGIYPRDGSSIEDYIEDFECENCERKFDFEIIFSPTWTAIHPNKCDVKGYHMVIIKNKSIDDTKGCLYCDVTLDCDCPLWDHDIAKEEIKKMFGPGGMLMSDKDRNGHCTHKIESTE